MSAVLPIWRLWIKFIGALPRNNGLDHVVGVQASRDKLLDLMMSQEPNKVLEDMGGVDAGQELGDGLEV